MNWAARRKSVSDLQGKVAVVTGGARGMGEATCRLFAELGARVVIADVLEAEGRDLAAGIGGAAVFHRLDVGDEQGWRALVEETEARWGGIDVLVNNAAILTFSAIVDQDVSTLERLLRVNLIGTFLGMKVVGGAMKARGKGGAIVNISSVDGLRGTNGLGAYASSKWGVRGLTKVAALEFGHLGIRVNSIHPGGVNTVMGNPRQASADELNRDFVSVPLQRIGEPAEIARVSAFLASDAASYVNGAEIAVDGGWTVGGYLPMLPGAPAPRQAG
jgi:3alpha(or 20beta)-hydroxysteroid dehydrogenase